MGQSAESLVTIIHYIPTEEEAIHEATSDCPCEPQPIRQELLQVEDDAIELVLEHHTFSPLTNSDDYVVIST